MSNQKFFTEQHLNEQGISLYIDAIKLSRLKSLPDEILHHVEECEECKTHIMETVDIMKGIVFDTSMQHPYFDARRTTVRQFSIAYKIAAVFIIAAFAGTFYFIQTNSTVVQKPNITQTSVQPEQTDSSSPESVTKLFADNFVPSPNLDDLVRTEFRSPTIYVLSPKIEEVVKIPITFRWKQYDKHLKIKILTNKETTLLTSVVKTNFFTTTKRFEPGLYYWKLEAEDELLYTGKFFVK